MLLFRSQKLLFDQLHLGLPWLLRLRGHTARLRLSFNAGYTGTFYRLHVTAI